MQIKTIELSGHEKFLQVWVKGKSKMSDKDRTLTLKISKQRKESIFFLIFTHCQVVNTSKKGSKKFQEEKNIKGVQP